MNMRRIEAAAVIALGALLGCASYDARLIGPQETGALPPNSTADARVPNSQPDAGKTIDAGQHPQPDAGKPVQDAGHTPDARVDAGPVMDAGGAHDAATDAASMHDASMPDAACGSGDADVDCCPNDPKTAPGQCGCAVADTDGDSDGTADCNDTCPQDGMKTAPGICGCGRPDSDQGAVVSCAGLVSALVHRYRFDGSGTTITDAKGDQDGVLQGTTLTGSGQLDLAGGSSNDYVDLPNGLVSSLTDATFEVWLTWSGGAIWERVFDFGDNSSTTEGNQGTGKTYLFLTPRSNGTGSPMRVAYSTNGSNSETQVDAASELSTSGTHHIAVVVDDTNDMLRLYLDGADAGSKPLNGSLSSIHDINNWLGRSQYSSDGDFGGSLLELRIYNAALSAGQIAQSFADGPDPAYLEP